MTLYLAGHRYRFAMEEGVVSFTGFKPDETVETSARFRAPAGDCVITRLGARGETVVASAFVRLGGATARGLSRADARGMSEGERARAESHALKIALYKALTRLRGEPLAWGSLSGMRPAKLAAKLISECGGEAGARRTLERKYLVL